MGGERGRAHSGPGAVRDCAVHRARTRRGAAGAGRCAGGAGLPRRACAAGVRPVLRRRFDPAGGAAAGAAGARLGPQPGGGAGLQSDVRDSAEVRERAAGEPGRRPAPGVAWRGGACGRHSLLRRVDAGACAGADRQPVSEGCGDGGDGGGAGGPGALCGEGVDGHRLAVGAHRRLAGSAHARGACSAGVVLCPVVEGGAAGRRRSRGGGRRLPLRGEGGRAGRGGAGGGATGDESGARREFHLPAVGRADLRRAYQGGRDGGPHGRAADGGRGGGEGRACLSRPYGGDGGGRAAGGAGVAAGTGIAG